MVESESLRAAIIRRLSMRDCRGMVVAMMVVVVAGRRRSRFVCHAASQSESLFTCKQTLPGAHVEYAALILGATGDPHTLA